MIFIIYTSRQKPYSAAGVIPRLFSKLLGACDRKACVTPQGDPVPGFSIFFRGAEAATRWEVLSLKVGSLTKFSHSAHSTGLKIVVGVTSSGGPLISAELIKICTQPLTDALLCGPLFLVPAIRKRGKTGTHTHTHIRTHADWQTHKARREQWASHFIHSGAPWNYRGSLKLRRNETYRRPRSTRLFVYLFCTRIVQAECKIPDARHCTFKEALSLLMLYAPSNHRRPFSCDTKMADFGYSRVLSVFSWKNKCIEYGK